MDCQYDIYVRSGNGIRLSWSIFDISGYMDSNCSDYVEVFIGCGRSSIGRYCSDNRESFAEPFDMYSPDNCLRIKFHSDSSGTGRGFVADYSAFSLGEGNKT